MARTQREFQVEDINRGKVNFRVIDRITPDDVISHLIEREIYKVVGGQDPGDELNKEFIDFLVLERYQREGTT